MPYEITMMERLQRFTPLTFFGNSGLEETDMAHRYGASTREAGHPIKGDGFCGYFLPARHGVHLVGGVIREAYNIVCTTETP